MVLIALVFVGGAGTAYAGVVLPTITLAGDVDVIGDMTVNGDCAGCVDFYQINHLSLTSGLNDLSCNDGDPVINGGGWSPSTTSWIRESWAFQTDTWRLAMTDGNGNGIVPGAFKITCADLDPFEGCGDGNLDPGEQCDNGINTAACPTTEGCGPTCQFVVC